MSSRRILQSVACQRGVDPFPRHPEHPLEAVPVDGDVDRQPPLFVVVVVVVVGSSSGLGSAGTQGDAVGAAGVEGGLGAVVEGQVVVRVVHVAVVVACGRAGTAVHLGDTHREGGVDVSTWW